MSSKSIILPALLITLLQLNPTPLNSFTFTLPQPHPVLSSSQRRITDKTLSNHLHSTSTSTNTSPNIPPPSSPPQKPPTIVLLTGFESFNHDLYEKAAKRISDRAKTTTPGIIDLRVFSDNDIRRPDGSVNPTFATACDDADAIITSLVFDYDDVRACQPLLEKISGPRFVFECATELMVYNRVGDFNMDGDPDKVGPPAPVKAVLKQFSSGREEDKLAGYLKMLKAGPEFLQFVPGRKASDLRTWLTVYRFWNQGGVENVSSMLSLVAGAVAKGADGGGVGVVDDDVVGGGEVAELIVTPDIGLVHPLLSLRGKSGSHEYMTSPKEYLRWRSSKECSDRAREVGFRLAPSTAPRVAVLLYRKHVISELRYINDLIEIMESQGIIPIPIFINGVEAHTIVRDLLTSNEEERMVREGKVVRDSSFDFGRAVTVDAIVNTIGFPLVGGPAGSMEAGRNVDLAAQLLQSMNVPYIVASPLLLQSIPQWKQTGVLGLQSVCLYALPELDGAIDTVVLGGLVGDKIALVPERVRKLCDRVTSWVNLRRTPPSDRKIAVILYGFPPNVGAVGTAALLDVPSSLERLLDELSAAGYDVGEWSEDKDKSGQSLVAALGIMSEESVISAGSANAERLLDERIERARAGDNETVAACLSRPRGGLGGAKIKSVDVSRDDLDEALGPYMAKKVRRAWSDRDRGPGVNRGGDCVVSGLELGNVFIAVQPLLGIEGDPMRLLFERDLTPHPQYCAFYHWLQKPLEEGGLGSYNAYIHLGMHGTVEWLPGQQLGNDRQSWSDDAIGSLPNVYVYAANNPSESLLAKRRGYGTLVSYNVPPYGRAGLYLELKTLQELVDEYRGCMDIGKKRELREVIYESGSKSEIVKDVPLEGEEEEDFLEKMSDDVFDAWILKLSEYLIELQDRLFSSGLHTLGAPPTDAELHTYLSAYFNERLSSDQISDIIASTPPQSLHQNGNHHSTTFFQSLSHWFQDLFHPSTTETSHSNDETEGKLIVSKLHQTTDELSSILQALSGGYVPPAPGGDLLRDGAGVLPTGRNIHALDPYRMPSAGAWVRGERIAKEIIERYLRDEDGKYPETVAVTLWGLDAIKTRGESVAIVLALVGARPVKEGTGRIVNFELIPLEELGRPRIDVLASMSGIFRDSFANLVDLLDDMFERAAVEEGATPENNYIKKHAMELVEDGVTERTAARLFSNPPGDYGSMVNEIIGSGDWDDDKLLGETWKSRNVFSYGKNEDPATGGAGAGTARPEVLEKLLTTTDQIVQEIDSVEYGITDIQEYYANTGALKKAAENRKTGPKKKVALAVVEAYGGNDKKLPIKDLESVLRIEYRSKFLNPKWRDAMLAQGSGGAFEVSQRMTAMLGWAATTDAVDNFVFDQAAERYALDDDVAGQLRRNNPEAFKNVVRRLLEAHGRGMWEAEDDVVEKLRDLYSDADDLVEKVAATVKAAGK